MKNIFSDPDCFQNFSYYESYYDDYKNLDDKTIWYNPDNRDYMHPKEMELRIQGLAKDSSDWSTSLRRRSDA